MECAQPVTNESDEHARWNTAAIGSDKHESNEHARWNAAAIGSDKHKSNELARWNAATIGSDKHKSYERARWNAAANGSDKQEFSFYCFCILPVSEVHLCCMSSRDRFRVFVLAPSQRHFLLHLYNLRSWSTPLTNLLPRLTRGCTDLTADCCTSMNEVVQY